MTSTQKKLIRKARYKYKKIFPCGSKISFGECFTIEDDKVFFWFDTEDRSTHVLAEVLAEEAEDVLSNRN